MVVISFSVSKDNLLDGSKAMTIRRFKPKRFGQILTANDLQIYWKQRTKESQKLFDAELRSITVFRFSSLSEGELWDLAIEDGFSSAFEMRMWFIDRYGIDAWETGLFMAIRFRRM
jgi:hypothetical protein